MMSGYKDNYGKIEWSHKPVGPAKKVYLESKRSHLPSPMVSCDYEAYDCPITGRPVSGKAEHNANLLKHGCRIQEKGEFEDVKKNGQKRVNAEMDKAIDKSVDAIANQIDF
tara:strand:+ start:320 stop:652 length:333 start_codon:yes stop_codon:yes gene_type:complete